MGTRIVKHRWGATKYITNYYLEINDERVKMRTKHIAIEHGRIAYKSDNTVKLIEKTIIWDLYYNKIENSSTTQEFDRTILIIN